MVGAINLGPVADNLRILGPFAAVCWLVYLLMVLWRPQRYRNCFVLMGCLGVTGLCICGLFGEEMSSALIILLLAVVTVIFLVPAMLIINGIVMIKKEGKCLAHLLSLGLGIFVGIGEIATVITVWWDWYGDVIPWFMNVMYFVSSSVFYFCILILSFVLYVIAIQVIPHRTNFNYIIILGCGLIGGEKVSKILSNRLDKAISVYQKSRTKPILIPSGGKGSDEKLSESEAMKNYLVEKGIPEEDILMEDQSVNTQENLRNSFAIINSREGKKKTAIVTTNYHVYRALHIAYSMKIRCTGIGARVASYFWPSAVIREWVAVVTQTKHLVFFGIVYVLMVIIPLLTIL